MADLARPFDIALFSSDHRTVMGVKCVVSASGTNSPIIVQKCLDAVEELEQLWSRFLPHSDICRLNAAQGEPIWVDARTVDLVRHMVSAHAATQGVFNPTLLPLQIASGDSRSLIDNKESSVPSTSVPAHDLSAITVHADGRISLPPTMSLDAGGIAKGFAADLLCTQALALGATDVCVNLGGDMSMHTNSDSGWRVDILSPVDRTVLETVTVHTGGVATSAINARNRNGQEIVTHIFSPQEHGQPCALGASVIANTAAWAEAWTKFAILTPTDSAVQELDALGLAALIIDLNGNIFRTSTWKDFIL